MSDSPQLRSFLFDNPVGLVVVSHAGRKEAIALSTYSEAAHHPTTMWISVARSNPLHEMLVEAGRFTFVTLHRGQGNLAKGCGAEQLYEFAEGFWFVRDALACVACRISGSEPVGDHTLFIAEMLAGVTDSRCSVMRPLLMSDLRAR